MAGIRPEGAHPDKLDQTYVENLRFAAEETKKAGVRFSSRRSTPSTSPDSTSRRRRRRWRSSRQWAPTTSPSSTTRSEEHTSELQSLMRISYAVFSLKKKKNKKNTQDQQTLR